MATRAPTSFSTTEPTIQPRKPILAADADDLLDDQQLVLDKNEMVIGDQFTTVVDSSVATWTTFRTYYTRAPNMCGTSSTITAMFSFLCKSSNSTDFQIRIYHNGRAVAHTYTVAASHTSMIWRPWTACTLYGDGTENELLIQMNDHLSPGSPGLYLGGVAVFTNY